MSTVRHSEGMDIGDSKPLYFARVNSRSDRRVFGIRAKDRFSHVYVIGKTGTGKSTLLEAMALQDMEQGNGLALIDPHGDLVSRIAERVPAWRQADVRYLNVPDKQQPYGYLAEGIRPVFVWLSRRWRCFDPEQVRGFALGPNTQAHTDRTRGGYPYPLPLLKCPPARLVTIALANKLARICSALMNTGELYRTGSANAEARAAAM